MKLNDLVVFRGKLNDGRIYYIKERYDSDDFLVVKSICGTRTFIDLPKFLRIPRVSEIENYLSNQLKAELIANYSEVI